MSSNNNHGSPSPFQPTSLNRNGYGPHVYGGFDYPNLGDSALPRYPFQDGHAFGVLDFLRIVDWLGTVMFGMSGALTAASSGLNMDGMLFLAVTVAIGGGTIRDFALFSVPIFWLEEWEYFVMSIVSGLFVCFLWREIVPPGAKGLWLKASDAKEANWFKRREGKALPTPSSTSSTAKNNATKSSDDLAASSSMLQPAGIYRSSSMRRGSKLNDDTDPLLAVDNQNLEYNMQCNSDSSSDNDDSPTVGVVLSKDVDSNTDKNRQVVPIVNSVRVNSPSTRKRRTKSTESSKDKPKPCSCRSAKQGTVRPKTALELAGEGGPSEGELMWWGDTLGLAVFGVIGCRNAMRLGFHPLIALVAACVTGCGGGVVRDIVCGLPVQKRSNCRIFHSVSSAYVTTVFLSNIPFVMMAYVAPFAEMFKKMGLGDPGDEDNNTNAANWIIHLIPFVLNVLLRYGAEKWRWHVPSWSGGMRWEMEREGDWE